MAITLQEIDAEIARRERIAEIDAEIERREALQNPSLQDQISTGQESLATLISGGIGALAGGITGAATTALTFDPAAGEHVRKSVQESLTINPSPQAQEQLQAVGDVAQSIEENVIRPAEAGTAGLFNVATHPFSNVSQGFAPSKKIVRGVKEQGLPKFIGQDVLEQTGSPFAATVAEIFTGGAEMLTGNLVGKYTNKTINEALKTSRGKRKLIANEILKGNANTKLVTKMVNDSGDVVTNPVAKKALKILGGDENAIELIAMVENMSKGSKKQFNNMLDIIEDVKIHPERKLETRHTDVIGKVLLKRVKKVNDINKRAGVLIGKIAKNEKRSPDISDLSNEFISKLEGMGTRFSQGDDGWITVNFDRSKFKGGDKQGLEVMINDLAKGDLTFHDAHTLKQTIRDNINYDVGGKDQLVKASEDLLSDLSGEINEKLRAISPVYKKANAKFADTIETKNAFDKLTGKDIDINDPLAYKMLGKKAMRLDSNDISAVKIEKAITSVDDTLAKFKIEYDDNIGSLILTAGRLEDAFKTQPKGSFMGRIMTATTPAAPVETAVLSQGISKFNELITPDFDKKMRAIRLLSKARDKK